MSHQSTLGSGRFVIRELFEHGSTEQGRIDRFNEISGKLGQVGIEHHATLTPDHEIRIEVGSEAEQILVNEWFYRDRNDFWLHTQTFTNSPLEYEQAWVDLACKSLDRVGIEYEVTHHDHRAQFKLTTALGQEMFSKLVNTGFLDKQAQIFIDYGFEPG